MSNAETVREFLEKSPKGVCDDCISEVTRIEPRQQVYQVCRRLEERGTITRGKDRCALCGHTKTLNVIGRSTSQADPATPLKVGQARVEPSTVDRVAVASIDNVVISGMPWGVAERLRVLESQIAQLLGSPAIQFDEHCRSALPEAHGIYRIFDPTKPHETVRAGRTKTAAGGLRQRVYQNHLMGNQTGNLRAQLVADGACADLEMAKRLIRESLAVQILPVDDEEERTWLEHFMLGVLRPRYCD